MKVIGYSERGMVNALFYEIGSSPSPVDLLNDLLKRARFPLMSDGFTSVVDAEIYLEQSFSQFGNADAVLLVNIGNQKISVFVEAKVKPSQTNAWTMDKEFEKFTHGTTCKVDSSNLFSQLYHKRQMVEALRAGGISAVTKGIKCPDSSKRDTRKIGANPVVRKAVDKVIQHLHATYYLAIVPGHPSDLDHFFNNNLNTAKFSGYSDWNVQSYGYLTWSEVEDFCTHHKLNNMKDVLDFNKGQIY